MRSDVDAGPMRRVRGKRALHRGRGRSEQHIHSAPTPLASFSESPSFIIVLVILLFISGCALSLARPTVDAPEEDVRAAPLVLDYATLAISPSRVYVDEPMTFYVNATSGLPSPTITVTIYFDYYLSDGSTVNPESRVYSESVTGPSANIVAVHSYGYIGNLTDPHGTYFQVRAEVSDGESLAVPGRPAYVVENTPPSLLNWPASTLYPVYNVSLNMSFRVMDWDNEVVTVTWDFGDGTEPVVNETLATPTGSYVRQNHTWVVVLEPGRDSRDLVDPYFIHFNMSVSFVDAFGHLIYSNHTVNITPPDNFDPWFSFTAASTTWSPGYELPLCANAVDQEGDPLTWTFVFNDTIEDYLTEVYHTGPTAPETLVWQNTSHTFAAVGSYTVTLYISDALEPYQVRAHNKSQTIGITVVDNREPGVLANITMTPTNPRINTTLGYAEVVFSIQAFDFDGDVLYLHWDFGDGETAENESAGGTSVQTFVQTHRYTYAGEFNVSVLVDDNRGHKVLRYRVFMVLTNNSAPVLRYVSFELSNGVFAAPGSTVNVTMTISDRERDPLTIWVDFGDNSSLVRLDLADFSENNTVTAVISHVYNHTGKYTVNITFTDWQFGPTHNVTVSLSLEVKVPRTVVVRSWDWWDYTSLGLLVAAFASVLARWFVLGRFRAELDKRGLTLEEYRTIAGELRHERDAALKRIDAQVKAKGLDPQRAREMKAEVKDGYARSRKELRAGTWVKAEGGM